MTFIIYTLGCKVNSCESAAINDSMLAAGFEIVPDGEVADIAVINSCAVTSMSVKKARQLVSRCKKDNPEGITVLCGCFPQSYSEDASQTDADIIVGNGAKSYIPFLLNEYLKTYIFVNL